MLQKQKTNSGTSTITLPDTAASNGEGHRETWEHGRRELVVPTAPTRWIKRSEAHKVEQRRTMSTRYEHDFYDEQQNDLVSALLSVISLPQAVGHRFEFQLAACAAPQRQKPTRECLT